MRSVKRARQNVFGTVVKQMMAVQQAEEFSVHNPDDSNSAVWIAKMPSALFLESYLGLFEDLEKDSARNNRSPCIEFEFTFPLAYPSQPPFVRVIRPRFQFHTGHITIGGSICHESLTNQGWEQNTTIECLLHTLQQLMIDGKARVDFGSVHPYSFAEAKEAFDRVANDHGWK